MENLQAYGTDTIRLNGRTFTVTTRTDSEGRPGYIITGARGARYQTIRNARTGYLFLINTRRGHQGMAFRETTWLTDADGPLRPI
jgi:hypothetical protein